MRPPACAGKQCACITAEQKQLLDSGSCDASVRGLLQPWELQQRDCRQSLARNAAELAADKAKWEKQAQERELKIAETQEQLKVALDQASERLEEGKAEEEEARATVEAVMQSFAEAKANDDESKPEEEGDASLLDSDASNDPTAAKARAPAASGNILASIRPTRVTGRVHHINK